MFTWWILIDKLNEKTYVEIIYWDLLRLCSGRISSSAVGAMLYPLKLLGTKLMWSLRGFREPVIGPPWFRDAVYLSDGCTPDRCSKMNMIVPTFFLLIINTRAECVFLRCANFFRFRNIDLLAGLTDFQMFRKIYLLFWLTDFQYGKDITIVFRNHNYNNKEKLVIKISHDPTLLKKKSTA